MRGAAHLKLVLVVPIFVLLNLNYSRPISAHSGLISKSKVNSPDNPYAHSTTRETLRVDGENVIVAEGISCWEQNGYWEKLQVCPESYIVTAHRFRYLSRTGPTGIQLKCTEKYGDKSKSPDETILVIDFEGQVEKSMPRGGWENWKNGSSSLFAQGFSFNGGETSLGRSIKNYDLVYHSGNQMTQDSDSDSINKVVRKCPEDHAICGVTAMMDKAGLGILTALGLKCCHHCVPMETWETIHYINNTGVSKEEPKVRATVGLRRSLKNSADHIKFPQHIVQQEVSTHFRNFRSTGFDWSATSYFLWTTETLVTQTYTCKAQSSCLLKQLVGICGSVRVPVKTFCEVSVPIGSGIPDSCNFTQIIPTSETVAVPSSTACGGFINLDRYHEIMYQVPADLRGEKSVCLWVVVAPWASKIEMQVVNSPKATFQPEESTLIAVYNFTQNDFPNSKMLRKDEKWIMDLPFFILHFRTNWSAPNSSSGTGFHIHLKEAGKIYTQTPVTYLEVGLPSTGGAISTIQEFKYPQTPAEEYPSNDRTFIIVKPATRHGKVKLDLKSVSTERFYDWMEILTVESGPVSKFRFSGFDSWSNKIFEAEEDEPFIIFFHSDQSNEAGGFQLSVSEEMQKRVVTTLNVRSSCQKIPLKLNGKVSSLRSTSCASFYEDGSCSGGSVQLTGNHSDLSLHDLDDKISSFESCETTRKREESPLFLTAYDSENYKGESTRLSLSCGCLSLKFGWNDKINSIKNPQNLCAIGFEYKSCQGNVIRITSDSSSFQSQGMNNKLSSFRICPGTSNCPSIIQ